MEKNLQENEIKELEEEIDLAVDRLFVEKRKGLAEPLPQEPSALLDSLESTSYESTDEPGTGFDFAPSLMTALSPPPPTPMPPPAVPTGPSYLKSIDQLEAQLLSLEWEISGEKLSKTQEAVKVLRHSLKQREDVGSVLGFMKDLLDRMRADEDNIRPPMIKFLLDAKETVKLLLRQETDKEITIFKQLALDGIESRFGSMGETKGVPGRAETLRIEEKGPAPTLIEPKKEEIFNQWDSFFKKTEGILHQINQRLSQLEKVRRDPPPSPALQRETPPLSPLKDITVFRTGGKLVGVESEGIRKLFKVPPFFKERYAEQPRVRIREDDVTLIDLKQIFPEESWRSEGAVKLLLLYGEGGTGGAGECKGLIVEEILKRIMILPEQQGGDGRPLLGRIRWSYEAQPVDVPILDFRRL